MCKILHCGNASLVHNSRTISFSEQMLSLCVVVLSAETMEGGVAGHIAFWEKR